MNVIPTARLFDISFVALNTVFTCQAIDLLDLQQTFDQIWQVSPFVFQIVSAFVINYQTTIYTLATFAFFYKKLLLHNIIRHFWIFHQFDLIWIGITQIFTSTPLIN